MKSRTAFDLDGTLLNSDEIFKDHFRCQGFEVKENNDWEYVLDPSATGEEIADMIDDCIHRRTVDMDRTEGAMELVQKLYSYTGDPTIIVTARPATSAETTIHAIRRVCGNDYFMTGFANGLLEKIRFLQPYKVLFEDNIDVAIQLAKHRKIVIVPKKRYNSMGDIKRFEPDRGWTWLEEQDLKYYRTNKGEDGPDIFWDGRIIFVESLMNVVNNERLFGLLVGK